MEKIIDYLRADHSLLVLLSRPFDQDAIGSGLMLKLYFESLGKKVRVQFHRAPSAREREDLGHLPHFAELNFGDTREFFGESPNYDAVIFVDGANLEQFYQIDKDAPPPDIAAYNHRVQIDHHLSRVTDLGELVLHDSGASSTAEIILRAVIPGSAVTPEIAQLGYAAIAGDTGNFRYSFAADTLRLAATLIDRGANPTEIIERQFFSRDPKYLELTVLAIQNAEYYPEIATSCLTVPHEWYSDKKINSADAEVLKDVFAFELGRAVKGYARSFVFLEEIPGRIHVSARGSNLHNDLELPTLLSSLGGLGGGHKQSCSFYFKGTMEGVKEKVLKAIEFKLTPRIPSLVREGENVSPLPDKEGELEGKI